MTIEKISQSISMNVWGQAGIELTNPGSAFELTSNCVTGPVFLTLIIGHFYFMKFGGKKVCVCVRGGGGGGVMWPSMVHHLYLLILQWYEYKLTRPP